MATISTIGHNRYAATFNRRSLSIVAGKTLVATDTATGQALTGDELRSVTALVKWHVTSKRDRNELMTVATTRKDKVAG